MKEVLSLTTIFTLLTTFIFCQDISSIGNSKPFALGGGVSLNQIASFGDSYRSPYTYVASGNLNLSIYGLSIPASFAFSNEQFTYQQPFNQYSIHPSYKWISGHFGFTSVSFSRYTVDGHLFLGGALDITRGKWTLNTFAGRFLKETEPDSLSQVSGNYNRYGVGFRTGFLSGNTDISVSLFSAKDISGGFDSALIANNVVPNINHAIGVSLNRRIIKKLGLGLEWGGSLITENSNSSLVSDSVKANFPATESTTSTAFYNALKGSLIFQSDNFNVGTVMERVEPGYKTLGAYYFNSDLESIALTGSITFFEGKFALVANSGIQRDNLDGQKISAMKRWANAANLSFTPADQINVQLSYSSFSTYTNIQSQFLSINQATPYGNLDTLTFTQISENSNISVSYQMKSTSERRHSFNLSARTQRASDYQGERAKTNASNVFYNSAISYTLSQQPSMVMFSFSFNYSRTVSKPGNLNIYGPLASISKMLRNKKIRLAGSLGFNTTVLPASVKNHIYSFRFNTSYNISTSQQLTFSTSVLSKKMPETSQLTSELIMMLGYTFNF